MILQYIIFSPLRCIYLHGLKNMCSKELVKKKIKCKICYCLLEALDVFSIIILIIDIVKKCLANSLMYRPNLITF